jgi:hypothetical protein
LLLGAPASPTNRQCLRPSCTTAGRFPLNWDLLFPPHGLAYIHAEAHGWYFPLKFDGALLDVKGGDNASERLNGVSEV